MNLSLLTVLCHGKNNSQLKELLKNNKILNFINTFIKDKPYYETPFRFLKLLSKNATLPACIICGNIISYSIWNRRNNAKFCSKTCKYSKEGKENTRKNIEKTLIEKYKVKNILQHKKFKEKQELTCLAKYGTKFYSKTSECKEKVKKTSLEKFGTNNVMFNKKVLKNIKNNNLSFRQEKIQRMLSQTVKAKYELKPEVNILLLEKIIDQIDNEVISILSDKKYAQYFDKNVRALFEVLTTKRYKYNPIRIIKAFLHNIHYKYISSCNKMALKALKLMEFNFKLNIDDARQAIKNDNEIYNYINEME